MQMIRDFRTVLLVAAGFVLAGLQATCSLAQVSQPSPIIERLVPPVGLEIPVEKKEAWLAELRKLEEQANTLGSDLVADVQVLLKACRYAVQFQELYSEKDFAKVDRLLGLALERIGELGEGQASWSKQSGRQVRGFRSQVDGSVQPIGLVLPDEWQTASKPLPLYVWLHGRGDQATDLHFLCERLDKDGQIKPPGAIVVHPFGRQCIGYKSAGETDVMEAIDFVCKHYPIDKQRIVLMGFSMGGAGVWHLAAHYGERFVAASSGAGFAETARYQNLKPENYPPRYEQILWSIYDVPGYTRNLFNLPFVAYSGELDKQIQAARVMEEAFKAEGRELVHLIGPGMGHKYAPQTLAEIMQRMALAVDQGQPTQPTEFFIQTKHPRYSRRHWLTIDGPIEQYADTRATATLVGKQWQVVTKNVQRLSLDSTTSTTLKDSIQVDGDEVAVASNRLTLLQRLEDGKWKAVEQFPETRKYPGLSGPIDDAFIDPFLVVLPSGKSSNELVERWVQSESQNLAVRWQTLFRGELRAKLDTEVTKEDMQNYHLVVWGDPQSNSLLKKILDADVARGGPLRWSSEEVAVGQRKYAVQSHIPLAIRPNPFSFNKYVVINSGPTFRQAHDRTNSLQNPHLPDWAVISLDSPPSAESAGRVAAAGFFDDNWNIDANLSW